MSAEQPATGALDAAKLRRLEQNVPRFLAFRALISFQMFFGIWVIYLQEDRGLTLGQVTAMEGPFWLAMVLLEVPTGAIADRFGRKTSLVTGAWVYAIAVLVFALAGNYPLLFASYMAFALAMTLFSGADSALFYDSLKSVGRENDYQRLWGFAWAVQSGAAAVAIFIAGPAAAWAGLQAPILFDAGIAVLAALLALSLAEPPHHEAGTHQVGMVAGMVRAAKLTWHTRTLRLVLFFGSFVTAGAVATDVLVQPFLRSHDISIGWFGPMLLAHSLAATVAALAANRVQNAMGWRSLLVLLLATILVPLSLLAVLDTAWVFAAYLVLGAAAGLQEPILSDFMNRRVPSNLRATALSLRSLSFSLVLAALLPILGAAGEREGLTFAYAIAAVLVAAVGMPLLPVLVRAIAGEPPPPILGDDTGELPGPDAGAPIPPPLPAS